MRTNYILVDYENVQPRIPSAAINKPFYKVVVFVGAKQTNIPFELAAQMQRLGGRASYVKVSGCAKDALDFHLAYYLGQLTKDEPNAYFQIISKDTGFDPLIAHLAESGIAVRRFIDIINIPALKEPAKSSDFGCLEQLAPGNKTLIAWVSSLPEKSRPKTLGAMRNHIAAHWGGGDMSSQTATNIINRLVAAKSIRLSGQNVEYLVGQNHGY